MRDDLPTTAERIEIVAERLDTEPMGWLSGRELAAFMRGLGWTRSVGERTLREGVERGRLTRKAYQEGPARYVYRASPIDPAPLGVTP